MKVKRRKQKGFTLMELLAVIAIMAIIGNVILSLFISSQKTFIVTNNENIIQDEGRMIVEFLERDLKIGRKKAVKDLASGVLAKVEIDNVQYNCSFAGAKHAKPIFAFTMKEKDDTGKVIDVLYAYVQVENKLIKTKKSGTNTLVEMGTLTEHLKKIEISSTTPYDVEFILEATGSENKFNLIVTPRNS